MPLLPSVQMANDTSQPRAAQWARVAPAPNSMSSGWAPTGKRPGGHRQARSGRAGSRRSPRARSSPPGRSRSAGMSTSQPRTWSSTTWTASPSRAASAWWRANEPGSVGEAEAAPSRQRDHVGAIAVAVGHHQHPMASHHVVQPGGQRQVGVGDHHPLGTRGPYGLHARLHRAVEPEARRPVGGGAHRQRPVVHGQVVADHRDRQRASGPHHPGGHLSGEHGAGLGRQRRVPGGAWPRGTPSPGRRWRHAQPTRYRRDT